MTSANKNVDNWLSALLNLKEGNTPFPWQEALFERLREGDVVSTLDIPTGLGKTSVIGLWLTALACGAPLPRRLVYVVDRRAVVDQATEVADHIRSCVDKDPVLKQALKLERSLPVSTLRGQHVDNREWLEDPSCPAIIVGTVDMTGSRLLFEGYGVSRKMRPYHAGLLGVDTLVVLDEAHLVPPFERLLTSIAANTDSLGPKDPNHRALLPSFRVMSLSATGRGSGNEVFGLTPRDYNKESITRKRLDAKKHLRLTSLDDKAPLAVALAQQAWALSDSGKLPTRCLVFANERKVAQEAQAELLKLAKAQKLDVSAELFVGGRRVYERAEAAEQLKHLGFIAGSSEQLQIPAFLFATSAAEVGVDLDAEHMVCDLVPWERMVQRLGRVNRRGHGKADVLVLSSPAKTAESQARLDAVTKLLAELPQVSTDTFDASPGAIVALKKRASADDELARLVTEASTPAPLHPPLTRPLLDAWAMTSLEEHTGRADIEPWLRGWEVDDEPQTTVVWREILPIDREGQLLGDDAVEAYLTAAPPQLVESLEVETSQVIPWFKKRLELVRGLKEDETSLAPKHIVALVLARDGKVKPIRLSETDDDKRNKLDDRLKGATLIVDTKLGGLSNGLLAADSPTASDVASLIHDSRVPFRITIGTASLETSASDSRLRREAVIAIQRSQEEENENVWIYIDTWITEAPETEDGRSVSPTHEQSLDDHQSWAEEEAERIAKRLKLPDNYNQMLKTAARLHDEGKKAVRWQRAFGGQPGKVLAKSTTRPNQRVLGGYRHEFGSLPYAENDAGFARLSEAERDLCLHLIAAHHGRARPTIPVDGADDPPSKLEERAQQVAMRFARLSKTWGPWGLAWWEALLRAADARASRRNDEEGGTNG